MSAFAEPVGTTSGTTSDYYAKVHWNVRCVFPVDVWHIVDTGNERSEKRGTAKGGRIP